MPIPDPATIREKERLNEQSLDKQFLIAEPIPSNIDIVKSASWVESEIYSYGKFTIKADSAKTLSINFDRFFLPEGTEMYMYNQDGSMITGPITEAENNDARIWGSAIYKGQEFIIEIKVPTPSKQALQLHVSNVAYGYKQLFIEKTIGFGLSGPCNINVLCPLGNGWEDERNSVALITNSNGSALCTGALIANTCDYNIPYFLTANHCYNASPNVGGWRFQFQVWSPTCSPSQNSNGLLFNGSTLRANWSTTDFALVELTQTPPLNSGLVYAGWNRSATTATNATGIHHPSGDVMKISRDNNAPVLGPYPGQSGNNHWRVIWDQGVTEGGSSGSPLFDQNHRIIGQLHGGYSDCGGSDLRDFYGAFHLSWNTSNLPTQRLRPWLSLPGGPLPLPTTKNSVEVAQTTPPVGGLLISGSSTLCSGTSQYTLNAGGSPYTAGTVSWTSSDPSIATVSSTGNPATVTKVGNGTVEIYASIQNGCQGLPASTFKEIGIGTPSAPVITYERDGSNVYIFTATSTGIPLGYDWWVNGVRTRVNASAITYLVVPCGQTVSVYCNQTNSCGTSPFSNTVTVTNNCLLALEYTVFPNPATNSVTIRPASIEGTDQEHAFIKYVNIYDNSGSLKKEVILPSESSEAVISLSGMEPGIYILEIGNERYAVKEKLIVSPK